MNLRALVDFNLVAIHGGIGKASRASGRPKTTLSRHIAELEDNLGVRLIERGVHALRLTEEGRALHARTEGLLDELSQVQASVRNETVSVQGTLRISASLVFSHVVLGRIAADFAHAYPEVRLEITAEDRLASPVEDGYDIVFRIDPADDDQLVGRCILRTEMLLVGAPAVLASTTRPDKSLLPAVVRHGSTTGSTPCVRDGKKVIYHLQPVVCMSSLLMVRDAAMEGVGVAILPAFMVERDLLVGRLQLLGALDGPLTEIWALHNSRRMVPARVRTFLEFVAKSLENGMPHLGSKHGSTDREQRSW